MHLNTRVCVSSTFSFQHKLNQSSILLRTRSSLHKNLTPDLCKPKEFVVTHTLQAFKHASRLRTFVLSVMFAEAIDWPAPGMKTAMASNNTLCVLV